MRIFMIYSRNSWTKTHWHH